MSIKIYELNKVIKSPVIIILIILMIALNSYRIIEKTYIREDINIINDIVGEFGIEITNESIDKINKEYKENFKKFNELTEEKLGKTYKFIADFFNSNDYYTNVEHSNKFSNEEIKFFNNLRVLEIYSNLIKDQINEYEKIDFSNNALQKSKEYGLEGKALDIGVDRYSIAQSVHKETIEDKDHKNIFPLGNYWFYSLVFQDILFTCILEIIVMVVLITSYLVNYEVDSKTSTIVYATRQGRKNIKDKLFISIVSSVVVAALILGFTLFILYLNIDITNILSTSVRSAFNWEGVFPYIFWFDNSVGVQLILTIIIILICSALFSLITFIITNLVKSSYISFFIFFIIFGISVIIPSVPSKESIIYMNMGYDLFNLIIRPSAFFMVRAPMIVDKFYEVKTLFIWTIILVILSIMSIRKFKKESIN